MSGAEDGGPAFPISSQQVAPNGYSGMSLRDWFAGQALAGICAGLSANGADPAPRADFRFVFDHAVQGAYQIADAMLKARAAEVEVRDA